MTNLFSARKKTELCQQLRGNRIWLAILPFVLRKPKIKLRLHRCEQEYIFTPIWLCWCCLRFLDLLKDLSHCEHIYPFSLIWFTLWVFRLPDPMNDFSQSELSSRLSPVCESWCIFSSSQVLNIVSHIIQICSIFGGRVDTAHRVKHLTYYRQSY